MEKILTLLMFCILTSNLSGQSIPVEYKRYNEYNMQPEVWHFAGPQEAQVNGKGDLNLTIPIMTIPGTPGRDFDVTFSYKAGILYYATASWIGLGWNFDPGSISRDVQGNMKLNNTRYGPDYTNDPGTWDRLPDIYYLSLPGRGTVAMGRTNIPNFNLPGGGASFLHPYSGVGGFYAEDYRPYKIEFETALGGVVSNGSVWWPNYSATDPISFPPGRDDIRRFTITTEDGVRYFYGLPSLAFHKTWLMNIPAWSYAYANAWRLLAIAGPDYAGTTDILLQDDPNFDLNKTALADYIDWIVFEYENGANQIFSGQVDVANNVSNIIQNTYLRKITTPTHYAEFIHANRSDGQLKNYRLPDPGAMSINVTTHYKRLAEIRLYSNTGASKFLIKKVVLTHIYDLAPHTINFQGKLTLKAIRFYSSDNTPLPSYDFDYLDFDSNVNGFQPDWEDDPTLYYYDGYGYYNNNSDNNGGPYTIPKNTIDYDTLDARAWSLKSVTFPTGATESYEYENDRIDDATIDYTVLDNTGTLQYNSYDFGNSTGITTRRQGGIRVTKISRTDGMGNYVDIDFEYGAGHAACLPPRYVPWMDSVGVSSVYRDEYHVVNRGDLDIVYSWVRKHISHNGNASVTETGYYGNDASQRLTSLLDNVTAKPMWFFHTDNKNWAWGRLYKKIALRNATGRGIFTDETTYNYTFVPRPASKILISGDKIQLNPLMKYNGVTFLVKQYSNIAILDSIKTYQTLPDSFQLVVTQRLLNDTTRQVIKTITTTSEKEITEKITYAHEINGYGGVWNTTDQDQMRWQNLLTPVARKEVYGKNLTLANPQDTLLSAVVTTFQKQLKWTSFSVEGVGDSTWKSDQQYVLNAKQNLTSPPTFSKWLGSGSIDPLWQLQFDSLEY